MINTNAMSPADTHSKELVKAYSIVSTHGPPKAPWKTVKRLG